MIRTHSFWLESFKNPLEKKYKIRPIFQTIDKSLPVLSFCWTVGMWHFNWQWIWIPNFHWTHCCWIQRSRFEVIFYRMKLSFVLDETVPNFQLMWTRTNTEFFCHFFHFVHVSNYFLELFSKANFHGKSILSLVLFTFVYTTLISRNFFEDSLEVFCVLAEKLFHSFLTQDTFQFCHMWMTFKNMSMNYCEFCCLRTFSELVTLD